MGSRFVVEKYLEQFPQLPEQTDLWRALIRTEFRTRSQFDPKFNFREFVLRFPVHYDHLVDDQIWNGSRVGGSTDGINENNVTHMSSRFRKIRLHEQGGLGNLWEGRDTAFKRKVAIKEIKSKFLSDDTHHRRFLREAQLTAHLEHPGIIPVYGKGEFGNGAPFFAMRFVEGESFKQSISNAHAESNVRMSKGSVKLRRLLRHFIDCCNTVSYAHANGIIHGDLKPSNIMIGDFGETVVIDWGLARIAQIPDGLEAPSWRRSLLEECASGEYENSMAGRIAGSPAFMSPEQRDDNSVAISQQSDIYSLGATLLFLVGNVKNPNNELDSIAKLGRQNPDLKPLLSVCKKAMQPNPLERYSHVDKLVVDIEYFLADQAVGAHKESLNEKLSRNSRRFRGVFNTALAGLTLISILAIGSAFWINNERAIAVEAKKETELALLQVNRKSSQLASQIQYRSRLLESLVSIFAGPGACSYGGELSLAEGLAKLLADASSSGDELRLGFFAGLQAKRMKAMLEYEKAIDLYRSAVETLSKKLASDDPMILEYQVGLTTALTARATEYNAGSTQQKELLSEANFLANSAIASIAGDDQRSKRLKFQFLSALPQIYHRALLNEEVEDVQDRFRHIWAAEVQATSPGSRRAATAAYYYANYLKWMKKPAAGQLCFEVSEQTLQAISDEETSDRVPAEIVKALTSYVETIKRRRELMK